MARSRSKPSKPTPRCHNGKRNGKRRRSPKSLFGPIRVPEQPSRQQWNLTTTMGGSHAKSQTSKLSKRKLKQIKNSSKKQSKQQRNGALGKGTAKPEGRHSDGLQLKLPIGYCGCRSVPWNRQQSIRPASAKASGNSRERFKRLANTFSIDEEALERLDAELENFSNYVCLDKMEVQSRAHFVDQIKTTVHNVFGILPYQVQVFGSFAVLPVCTFESDIDLAIHGLVDRPQDPTPAPGSATITKRNARRPRGEDETNSGLPIDHPNRARQEKVLRWKAALDEMDLVRDAKKEEKVVTDSDEDLELARHLRQPISDSANNDYAYPLFVIDREGSSENEANENSQEKKDAVSNVQVAQKGPPMHAKAKMCTVDSNEDVGSSDSDSDQDSADTLEGMRCRHDHNVEAATASPATPMDGNCHLSRQKQENRSLRAETHNDEDCDDEEEAMESRPRSRSIISLCSATTCSDTEEKWLDDSVLEVSFVSENSSNNRALEGNSDGPTGEARVLVVRALNTLSKHLRRSGLSQQLHVRKKARVPIINMQSRFGYECDIVIGGHNGTDTSRFAAIQCSRFRSFSVVVQVLKIILSQQGLDKPFTGGLGSFKLYVLVASHIEKHLIMGGADNPAEVLFMFLFRYSGNSTMLPNLDPRLKTELHREVEIKTVGERPARIGSGVADMAGVFKVDICVQVFRLCFQVLHRKLTTESSRSVLAYIIDAVSLEGERERSRTKVPVASPSRRKMDNSGSPEDKNEARKCLINYVANARYKKNARV